MRRLPRPEKKRLLDLRATAEPVDGLELFGEWARSTNDQNRLSAFDEGDNRDGAYHTGIRLKPLALDVGGVSLGRLSGKAERRFRGEHFASFVRTRPIEFGRKWNLPSERIGATGGVRRAGDETVDEASLRLGFLDDSEVTAEVGRLMLGEAFRGLRRAGRVRLDEAGWPRLDYHAKLVTSRDALEGALLDEDDPLSENNKDAGDGDDGPRGAEQIDGRWQPLERAVKVRGLYRAQTERAPLLEETYVQVGPERGHYVWEDQDDDGLVQNDEFLPERTPNERGHLRAALPAERLAPVGRQRGGAPACESDARPPLARGRRPLAAPPREDRDADDRRDPRGEPYRRAGGRVPPRPEWISAPGRYEAGPPAPGAARDALSRRHRLRAGPVRQPGARAETTWPPGPSRPFARSGRRRAVTAQVAAGA